MQEVSLATKNLLLPTHHSRCYLTDLFCLRLDILVFWVCRLQLLLLQKTTTSFGNRARNFWWKRTELGLSRILGASSRSLNVCWDRRKWSNTFHYPSLHITALICNATRLAFRSVPAFLLISRRSYPKTLIASLLWFLPSKLHLRNYLRRLPQAALGTSSLWTFIPIRLQIIWLLRSVVCLGTSCLRILLWQGLSSFQWREARDASLHLAACTSQSFILLQY